MTECNFAACGKEATEQVTLAPECGDWDNTIWVCPEHAAARKSPKPHTCLICGQRVHVIRKEDL